MSIDGISVKQFNGLMSPSFNQYKPPSTIEKIITHVKLFFNRLAHFLFSPHHRWENDNSLSRHFINHLIRKGPAKEESKREIETDLLGRLYQNENPDHTFILIQLIDFYKNNDYQMHNPELVLLSWVNLSANQKKKLSQLLCNQKTVVHGVELARIAEEISLTDEQLRTICQLSRKRLSSFPFREVFKMIMHLKMISHKKRLLFLNELVSDNNAQGLISYCGKALELMTEEERLQLGTLLVSNHPFGIVNLKEYLKVLNIEKEENKLKLAKAFLANTCSGTISEFVKKAELFKLSSESKFELAKCMAKLNFMGSYSALKGYLKDLNPSESQIIEIYDAIAEVNGNLWSVYSQYFKYSFKLTERIVSHLVRLFQKSEFKDFTPHFLRELQKDL